MASSCEEKEEVKVVGEKAGLSTCVLEKGAKLLQSLTPVHQFQKHASTRATYAQDMNRTIETNHFAARLNEDCLQCAVFDSDENDARLIGVEYIIADRLFLALPEEEQKLWHSHALEVEQGLWQNPGVPDAVQKADVKKLAKTYGKFWCTWQVDRGDKVPMGLPALMMSPQDQHPGQVPDEVLRNRDGGNAVSSADQAHSGVEIEGPQAGTRGMADHGRQAGKGLVVELEEVNM